MDRLTAIAVFTEVVNCRSFSLAAQKLDMSRAMVTRYIGLLEEWLGARLLQRSTRRLTLTEAGNQLLRQGMQVLQIVEQIELEQASQKHELSGNLRIACCVALASQVLAPLLCRFSAMHPHLKIELSADDRAINLIEHRIDLAVRISAAPSTNLVASRLAPCHSVLVAAPAYISKMGLPSEPMQLLQHQCLSYANFGKHTWSLKQGAKVQEFAIPAQLSADETSVVLRYALAGAGIAMQPCFLVHDLIREGKLVQVLSDWQAPEMTIYALYASRRHLAPAVRQLLDFLRQEFKHLSWQCPWPSVNTPG